MQILKALNILHDKNKQDCSAEAKAAYVTAITALNKEMAVKPDYQAYGYREGHPSSTVWICPECRQHIKHIQITCSHSK